MLVISLLFYRSLSAALFLAPLGLAAVPLEKRRRREARRRELVLEFCDGMKAYANALRAGYAPENALVSGRREVCRIYGEGSMMAREFALMVHRVSVNSSMEEALTDLAERSGVEEIREMAEVFGIAKRSGGSLAGILTGTVRILEEQGRLREEIRTITTARRLEHRVMCLMPAAILVYVNLTSPEFLAPLYEGLRGRSLMTVFLLVYGLAAALGERILRITI